MISWDDFEAFAGRMAGVLGAVVSMRFGNGTLVERTIMVIGGASFSYYASDWVSSKLSMPEGLTGFLLGLYGMAILTRAWEWMQSTDFVRDVLDFWIRKRGEK